MADARTVILAADVGGTNSRVAFFAPTATAGGRIEPVWQHTYPSRASKSLSAIMQHARAESGLRPTAACLGVAGPVRNGVCQATNLPWFVDSSELAAALELPSVGLLNDLEAAAHGLATLRDGDLGTIQAGVSGAVGNRAFVSAGTGLGQAGLYWDGRRHHPFACEGGHATFAPTDALQDELQGWLRGQFGHVSWERVLSGPGLVNLYQFLGETKRGGEPLGFDSKIRAEGATAITRSAMDRTNERAALALDLFCDLYGSQAGNVALATMATGGVYLGGGIAPKIEAWLARSPFLRAFAAKGRMQPMLEAVPVRVVRSENVALLGAARHALRTA